MPEPRRDTIRAVVPVTLELGRRDPVAARRRYRHGAMPSASNNNAGGSLPVEIRNGLPFKPYRYRGLGYDQLTGGDDAQD